MPDAETQCNIGRFFAFAKRLGFSFEDTALNKKLRTPHAKAVYANSQARYFADVGDVARLGLDANNPAAKAMNLFENMGIPVRDLYAFTAAPEAVLGKDVVDQVNAVYTDFIAAKAKFGKNQALTPSSDLRNLWLREYAPRMRKIWGDTFLGSIREESIDFKRAYIERYFNQHIQGGQFFNFKKVGPITRLARNAVGNLVAWNPMITLLNVFEFTPKALSYAIQQRGPVEGTAAVLKAMSTYFGKTGGAFWKKIPELEQLGIYGAENADGLFKGTLLDITENPLRGLSYYVGEALQTGTGRQSLESIAFVNRLGNEPLIFLDHQGKDSLALMRFSIHGMKFYLGMLNQMRKGNKNAWMAFGAFSLMTALQTGSSSAVPSLVDIGLDKFAPDEYRQFMRDVDAQTPFNLVGKTLGTDLSEQTRPLAFPAVGAGFSIVNQDVRGTGSALARASEALGQGELEVAGTELLRSFFAIGQLGKIGPVNLTTKRMVDAVSKQVSGDTDSFLEEFLTSTKLKQPLEE